MCTRLVGLELSQWDV
uniref:Uncharacterized protein n=1 Tax=Vitis vinifera TaxID=29760 RepID=F6I6X0_VITVI